MRLHVTATTILGAALVAATIAQGAARANDTDEVPTPDNIKQQASYGNWKNCVRAVNNALKAGAKPTDSLTLTQKSGGLKPGAYTYQDLHDACAKGYAKDAIERYVPNIVMRLQSEMADVQSGKQDDATDLRSLVSQCDELADDTLGNGAAPDTAIAGQSPSTYKGTIGTLKADVCDKGRAAIAAYMDTVLAPYKKAGIKGDKWDYLVKVYPEGIYVPGVAGETKDPKQLARASVWFDINYHTPGDDEHCDKDYVYTYFRSQFDKNGKLVNYSSKKYCGDPGPKALK